MPEGLGTQWTLLGGWEGSVVWRVVWRVGEVESGVGWVGSSAVVVVVVVVLEGVGA